jgi:hypothetical protein
MSRTPDRQPDQAAANHPKTIVNDPAVRLCADEADVAQGVIAGAADSRNYQEG